MVAHDSDAADLQSLHKTNPTVVDQVQPDDYGHWT